MDIRILQNALGRIQQTAQRFTQPLVQQIQQPRTPVGQTFQQLAPQWKANIQNPQYKQVQYQAGILPPMTPQFQQQVNQFTAPIRNAVVQAGQQLQRIPDVSPNIVSGMTPLPNINMKVFGQDYNPAKFFGQQLSNTVRDPAKSITSLAQGNKATFGDVANIVSVLPMGKIAKLGKVLPKTQEIRAFAAANGLKNYESFATNPNAQMQILTNTRKIANKIIPDVINSKEMKRLEQVNPAEWRHTIQTFLEDRVNMSRNPTADFGLSTRNVKPNQAEKQILQTPKSSSVLPPGVQQSVAQNMVGSLDGSIPQGKIRGFAQTVIDTKGIPKDILDFAKTQTYEPLKNAQVLKTVSKIIKQGDSQAISFAKTDETVHGNATAMVMLKKLIDKGRIDEANDLIAAVSPRFTKQGQEIQILSQFSRLKPEGAIRWAQSLIDKANKANPRLKLALTPQNTENIVNRAKVLQGLPDGSREKIVATAELVRDIHGVIPPSLGQRIATIQTMAQLLNPKTLVRNIGGNTIFGGLENVSDVVGTGIDRGVSLFTGQRSKVLPSLGTQGKGFIKGLKEGATDALKGIDTSGGVATQFDLPGRTFTGKYNPLTYLEKTMNVALRAPDRAAFKAAHDGSLNNQMRAAGVSTPTPAMLETAFADGLYRTFQDNSTLAQIFTGAKKLMNKAGTPDGKFGLGDFVLKYPKTPANLLSRGLDYSPVGFLKGLYQGVRPLITGHPFEQKTFVEALSRGMVGSGVMGAGYMLAKNGILSGRPSKDYDIAASQREQGSGPFRINVDALKRYFLNGQPQTPQAGDQLVSFDWAQPGSLPLAMGANMQINPKGQDQFSAAIEQLDAGASTLTQQSLFTGVTNLTKDISQYGPVRAGMNAVLGAPSGFVPTLSNQIVQATDNTSRETYDPSVIKQSLNKATAKIPGLEQNLPAKIGVLGQPSERYQGGSNNIFNVFFNPAFVSKISANPSAKEVLDIYNRSGETQQAPRLVDKRITVNGQNMVLTPEQLGKYQTYVGQRADQAIQTVMNDPIYQKASDDEKAKFIGNILSDINSAAKIEIFGNQPKTTSKSIKGIIGGTFAPQTTNSQITSMGASTLGGPNYNLDGSPRNNTTQSTTGSLGVTLTKDGNLSLTNTNQDLVPPKLTGNTELDKKLISKFNGEITARANDIMDLYNAGKLTATEAETELNKLKTKKASVAKGKKPKKVAIRKAPSFKKLATVKAKKIKLSKLKFAPKGAKNAKVLQVKAKPIRIKNIA
ncbi:MAG: hypothetical protein M0P59_13440 [Gallionella sp.]|jgi:hypothetical protein|nr:hypothetical protein [Gallionella sp.]